MDQTALRTLIALRRELHRRAEPAFQERETVRTLQAFLGATFSESMLIPLSGADRNAIAEELVHYLEFHTELPLNIRSLKVLRELYGA